MASIFTRILQGEIPSAKLYEDDLTYAFLDINPATRGHALVISKAEAPTLLDLTPEQAAAVALTAQKVAQALVRALRPDGFNIVQNNGAASGQVVPHYHIHIIPRWEGDGALAHWKPGTISPAELSDLAAAISSQLGEE